MKNRLVRVLKKVKTKSGSSHNQAFHVRKASPGDTYAQTQTNRPKVTAQPSSAQAVAVDQEQTMTPSPIPMDAPPHVNVEPLVIPWNLESDGGEDDAPDPVPLEIRKRFDPANKSTRARQPLSTNMPLFSIRPGEDLLWSSNEQELLNRLRTGTVTSAKQLDSACKTIMAKVEGVDGNIERAYIRFESQAEDDVKSLYGDMYELNEEGALSRRPAAAYELSKAIGMDDMIPPTVYRFNEHNGLEPIMSLTAMEDLAGKSGMDINELRSKLGDHASIELWTSETRPLITTDWFIELNSGDSVGLNDFYDNSPHRISLLRGAVLDFVLWSGTRTMADLLVCSNERHPLHLMRNDLSFPDPVAMGTAYIEYSGSFTDGVPSVQYAPMLWSDLVIQAALRGYDNDVLDYENIAIECTRRLKGDRVLDLVRSLNDHRIGVLAIAATLIRVYFLNAGARLIMRDPLIVARYFSSVLTGESFDPGFDIDIQAMEESVNNAINKSLMIGFDFVSSMRGDSDGDQ